MRTLWTHSLLALASLCLALTSPGVPGQTLEGLLSPGRLIAGHAKLENECSECHVRFDKAAQDRLCLGCHKPVAADVNAQQGYHGRIRRDPCRTCHTDHKGRDVNIAAVDEKSFNHTLTDFALQGAHARATCKSCHVAGRKWRDAPGKCADCHRKDDRHKGSAGDGCEACHTQQNWKETRFDHAKTGFTLADRHTDVACTKCHANSWYKDTPKTCIGCHRKDDTHKGRLGEKCESCHTARSWKELTFSHDRDTKFALRGRHRAIRCESCHAAPPAREKLSGTCIACHRGDDSHKGTLGTACANCHNERNWKEPHYDHDRSRFPLRGKHAETECRKCHTDAASFRGAPTACDDCHGKDDTHKGRYGEKCDACHTVRTWKPAQFDHDRATRYALKGAHRQVRCDSCHTGHLYRDKLASTCHACHKGDDKHRGQLGEKCESCHNETKWKGVQFDHDKSRFPLRGGHRTVKCEGCHASPAYKDARTECIACHRKDDRHKGHLGEKCETCHNDVKWKETRFDHDKTRFPLTGKHRPAKCESCHTSLEYKAAGTACNSCHAKEDVHKGALGARCDDCHSTANWKETRFDHDKTRFPLTGKHRPAKCESCHTSPEYKAAGTGCNSCHAKEDVHKGALGARCDDCHSTTDWKRTRFDHNRTRFPLLGRHARVECKSCHNSQTYRDAKSDCESCHLKDDTHRRTLGVKCGDCHNARDWRIWDFDHDRRTSFALDGAHRRTACARCHTEPLTEKSRPASLCIGCHQSDDIHEGEFGRQCERCHTTANFRVLRPGAGRAPGTAPAERPRDGGPRRTAP